MLYNFDSNYIQSLKDKFSFRGNTQILDNPRYYVSGLKIGNENLFVCVPLHSNGKYFTKIKNPHSSSYSKHWKNHGLNYEKILLLTKEEFDNYNQGVSGVDNNVFADIELKKENIQNECLHYLNIYLTAFKKRKTRQFITNEEKNILNFSSLNSFEDKVRLLLNIEFDNVILLDIKSE